MAQFPIRCTNCKRLSSTGSNFISVTGAAQITFSGENSFPCPHCGGKAIAIPGTYSVVDNVTSVIRGAHLSRKELSQLLEIVRESREHSRTVADTADSIAQQVPNANDLVAFLRDGSWTSNSTTTVILTVIFGILATLLAGGSLLNDLLKGDLDVEKLADQIAEKVMAKQRAEDKPATAKMKGKTSLPDAEQSKRSKRRKRGNR